MGLRAQVTPEQFKTIFNGPAAASQYVATASGGTLETIGEMMTAAKAMQAKLVEGTGSYGPLVAGIAEDVKALGLSDVDDITVKLQGSDMSSLRAAAKQLVADAAAAVAAMPGADGYKQWVLEVARAAAASKTGGFLGIGAKSVVDEKEEAALAELAALWGA